MMTQAKHLKHRITGGKTRTDASTAVSDDTENDTSTVVTPDSHGTVDDSDITSQKTADPPPDSSDDDVDEIDDDGNNAASVDDGEHSAPVDAATDDEKSESDDDNDNDNDDEFAKKPGKNTSVVDVDVDETAFGHFPSGQSIKNAISSAGSAVLHAPGNLAHMLSSMHEPSFEPYYDHTTALSAPYTGRDDPRLQHIFNPISYSGQHVDRP
jgi:hypothetical protein